MVLDLDMNKYRVKLAQTPEELNEIQTFRFEIFNKEFGNNLAESKTDAPGIDADFYDSFCDHLMVIDKETQSLIGTYRLMPGKRVESCQSFYCDNEFDLSRLPVKNEKILELGRSCVHPDYRDGSAIQALWVAITAYMDEGDYEILMGAVSLPLDLAMLMPEIASYLAHKAQAPDAYQCTVRSKYQTPDGLPLLSDYRMFSKTIDEQIQSSLPPLIKGYLNLNAWVASPPALDLEFGTFDFLVLLDKHRINPIYLKKFRRILTQLNATQDIYA